MQHFCFSEKVFGSCLDLFINCTEGEVENYLRHKLEDKDLKINKNQTSEGYYITLIKGRQQMRIMWVENFDWSVKSQAILAHELLHFVLAVLADTGIIISKDSEETMTYFFQSYYTQIWWKLRKLNPNYKPKKVYKRRKK